MPKQVLVVSQQTHQNPFLDGFEEFLRRLKPDLGIERTDYGSHSGQQYDLMFVEPFAPKNAFGKKAREFARKGLVFILEDGGLSFTTGDLLPGQDYPFADEPLDPANLIRRPLSGLTGVVYRMRDLPFQAFSLQQSGKAEDVLRPYL